MGKVCSREDIDKEVESSKLAVAVFYKAPFLKRKESDSEMIAEIILNINLLQQIKNAVASDYFGFRKNNFKAANSRTGIIKKQPKKPNEVGFSYALFNHEKEIPCTFCDGQKKILRIIDYQVPLKGKRVHPWGKIDLLAKDEHDHLYLIELKPPESTEPLLRAALEIFTYHEVLAKSTEAFLSEYSGKKLHKMLLVEESSFAGKTAIKLCNKDEPSQQKTLYQDENMKVLICTYKTGPLSPPKYEDVFISEGCWKPKWNGEFAITQQFPKR